MAAEALLLLSFGRTAWVKTAILQHALKNRSIGMVTTTILNFAMYEWNITLFPFYLLIMGKIMYSLVNW